MKSSNRHHDGCRAKRATSLNQLVSQPNRVVLLTFVTPMILLCFIAALCRRAYDVYERSCSTGRRQIRKFGALCLSESKIMRFRKGLISSFTSAIHNIPAPRQHFICWQFIQPLLTVRGQLKRAAAVVLLLFIVGEELPRSSAPEERKERGGE